MVCCRSVVGLWAHSTPHNNRNVKAEAQYNIASFTGLGLLLTVHACAKLLNYQKNTFTAATHNTELASWCSFLSDIESAKVGVVPSAFTLYGNPQAVTGCESFVSIASTCYAITNQETFNQNNPLLFVVTFVVTSIVLHVWYPIPAEAVDTRRSRLSTQKAARSKYYISADSRPLDKIKTTPQFNTNILRYFGKFFRFLG